MFSKIKSKLFSGVDELGSGSVNFNNIYGNIKIYSNINWYIRIIFPIIFHRFRFWTFFIIAIRLI